MHENIIKDPNFLADMFVVLFPRIRQSIFRVIVPSQYKIVIDRAVRGSPPLGKFVSAEWKMDLNYNLVE